MIFCIIEELKEDYTIYEIADEILPILDKLEKDDPDKEIRTKVSQLLEIIEPDECWHD